MTATVPSAPTAPSTAYGRELAVRHLDLDAVAHNVRMLRRAAGDAELMVVVKADGYAHGAVEVARTALDAGATWLGVAVLAEALDLRDAGIEAPLLAWLFGPGTAYDEAVLRDVDLGLHHLAQLHEAADAAGRVGRAARVHLKVDTGMGRGGVAGEQWAELVAEAHRLERSGLLDVVGVWSHLACADVPGDPSVAAQGQAFDEAVATARRAGLRPRVTHLANSAATLTAPALRHDLVRCGLAAYGALPVVDPAELPDGVPLRQALTVTARVTHVKRVAAGTPVSYGHTWVAPRETTIAVVPVGYADGIPNGPAGQRLGAVVGLAGRSHPVVGRVCMDQLMVDVGDHPVVPGDEVVVLGPGGSGEMTVRDWARASGRSDYEVLTGFAATRVPVRHRPAGPVPA